MADFTYEFRRESRRIDQMIWDAMALVRGERVLFCGFSNVAPWVMRAVEVGVDASVIESDPVALAELQDLRIPTLRGSTTLIPARDNSFDAIVAFHYLHEIDPTFHTQIVWELARVGKRVVIVEPAPPSDPLGKRISELYTRAKFEAGAFEEYQPIDYWRKLLAMVKADVLMQQFTFARLAPRFAVEETVNLVLDAMEVGQLPEGYMEELRELARRPEAQLSPLSRYVLVALGAGEPVRNTAGTRFREEDEPAPEVRMPVAAAAATPPPAAAPPRRPAPAQPAFAAADTYATSLEGAEFPPVLPPPGQPALGPPSGPLTPAAAPPQAPPAQQQPPAQRPPAAPLAPAAAAPAAPAAPFGAPAGPEPTFGLPDTTPFGVPPPPGRAAPFGTPFALPEDPDPFGLSPDPQERAGFGWNWEPPDEDEDPASDTPFGL
jgi:hypothetical protein